jgi:hypothetical protein
LDVAGEVELRHATPVNYGRQDYVQLFGSWRAWIDLCVLKADGNELDNSPRVHIRSGHVEKVTQNKGFDGAMTSRVTFRRRLKCHPEWTCLSNRLVAVKRDTVLKVSLCVEWPVLWSSEMMLVGCELALATLLPDF